MSIIAIPVNTDKKRSSMPAPHFGKSPFYYLIKDIHNPEADEVIPNTSSHFGGNLGVPDFLHSNGVNVVIASNMGNHAAEKLQKLHISLFKADREPLDTILKKYEDNQLSTIIDPCTHSGDHHH